MTPTASVTVGGSSGRETFEAIVDTGFSGYICIPALIGQSLGLVLRDRHPMQLANGAWIEQYVFEGDVEFLGKTFSAPILLTDAADATIGNNLIADCRLTIDYPAKRTLITKIEM